MRIDVEILSIVTIVTALIAFIFLRRLFSKKMRLPIILLVLSYYIYCGIGLSWVNDGSEYIFKYILYLLFLLISILLTVSCSCKGVLRLRENDTVFEDLFSEKISLIYQYKAFYRACAVGYLLCFVSYLIFPELRISSIIIPPLPSLRTKIQLVNSFNTISFFSLIDLLITLLLPFFLLYLQCLLKDGEKRKTIVLLALWIYLDYLRFEYLGRNEMVRYALLVFFIVLMDNSGNIKKIKLKYWIALGCLGIAVIPFLMNYTILRQGGHVTEKSNLGGAFRLLLETETYYPQYYNQILSSGNVVSFANYILWLIFLPMPSMLWPGKPTLVVNDMFTQLVTGLSRGQIGYSVELPSLLGEAMLIFGKTGYIFHAIILGMVVGIFCRFYRKYQPLYLVFIYNAILLVVLGRGGSGSYIPIVINESILLIAWIGIISVRQKKRRAIL